MYLKWIRSESKDLEKGLKTAQDNLLPGVELQMVPLFTSSHVAKYSKLLKLLRYVRKEAKKACLPEKGRRNTVTNKLVLFHRSQNLMPEADT